MLRCDTCNSRKLNENYFQNFFFFGLLLANNRCCRNVARSTATQMSICCKHRTALNVASFVSFGNCRQMSDDSWHTMSIAQIGETDSKLKLKNDLICEILVNWISSIEIGFWKWKSISQLCLAMTDGNENIFFGFTFIAPLSEIYRQFTHASSQLFHIVLYHKQRSIHVCSLALRNRCWGCMCGCCPYAQAHQTRKNCAHVCVRLTLNEQKHEHTQTHTQFVPSSHTMFTQSSHSVYILCSVSEVVFNGLNVSNVTIYIHEKCSNNNYNRSIYFTFFCSLSSFASHFWLCFLFRVLNSWVPLCAIASRILFYFNISSSLCLSLSRARPLSLVWCEFAKTQ